MDTLSSAPVIAHAAFADVARKTYDSHHNLEVVRWVPTGAAAVLDVGCGSGGNAAFLARLGLAVDGVTLSPTEAEAARPYCRAVALHNLESGLPGELRGPYDSVLCSHIIEHICFPSALLEDIRARLAPGGRLVAAIPNLLFWKNRLSLIAGRFDYAQGGIMDETHFRWYTLSTMCALLRKHGFEIEHGYGSGGLPLGPLRIPLCGLARHLDLAACRVLPGLFGWQLVVVATAA